MASQQHQQSQQQQQPARDLHKLAQVMCSLDLTESHWTQELPRLPVPDLWLTLNRYLSSLKAVLAPLDQQEQVVDSTDTTSSQTDTKRRQFRRAEQNARQFLLNEGPQLQRDLKEYANRCQNWATDYWLQDMYLANPLPLPVNSNPFFLFPKQQFNSSQEMLMFATRIIQFSVNFKCRIDQQTLSQDFGSGHGKGRPLCMETYKNFFHSYRMPHEDTDRLLPQSRRSNHIVVASCDQFYILRLGQDPLPDPYGIEAGASAELAESAIFEQLLRIYRVSREHARRRVRQKATATSVPPVGLFTTENRKVWAKVHRRLSNCHPNNAESLRQIEDCLFVMCLDSLVNTIKRDSREEKSMSSSSSSSFGKEEPSIKDVNNNNNNEQVDEQVIQANHILTGCGSHLFTGNRWFDKFLQIIVNRNGVCGINIEHSASEGITVLRFLEEFLQFIKQNPFKSISNDNSNSSSSDNSIASSEQAHSVIGNPAQQTNSITSPGYVEPKSPGDLLSESDAITPLEWILDEQLTEALEDARLKVDRLIGNVSLVILRFKHFGRAFIKTQKLSPDAFIQMALQFTYFKSHGCLVSTYESASLRQFRLGRVDNIRANTCEAYTWIQAMLKCKETFALKDRWREARAPFEKAIAKQVEILRYTITGSGPDNHLLALRQLARIRYDDKLPDLFADSNYQEFLNFKLSTSQLPNESGITVGYGAVTPDGYGCSYNPCESSIIFCVSTFIDCPETSSSKFATTLNESLLEMQELCLEQLQQ